MGRTGKPHIVVALQLNGATGRNEFLGISRFLSHGRTWNLTLAQSAEDVNAALARNEVDGAIVGLLHDAHTLELVASSRIPTVLIDIGSDRVGGRTDAIAYVRNDDLAIGRMAADFFASLGQFRAHAFVHPPVPRPWADLRERSFFEAVRTRNQPVFRPGENEDLGGFLKRLPKPAAVLAAWDRRAQDVIVAARKAGLKIPEQISVLGVDNDELFCNSLKPPLSSLLPDHEQVGFLAARELERLMRHGGGREVVLSESVKRVVLRESTRIIPPAARILAQALDYINEHATGDLRVSDVARRVGVSRRLLDLRFRQLHGETVLDAIVRARLDRIQRKLRDASTRVAEVAADCGFSSPAAFTRFFTAHVGVSPTAWRRRASSRQGPK